MPGDNIPVMLISIQSQIMVEHIHVCIFLNIQNFELCSKTKCILNLEGTCSSCFHVRT